MSLALAGRLGVLGLEVRIPKPEQRKPLRVSISVGGVHDSGKPAIEGRESHGAERTDSPEAQREAERES